MTAAANFPYPRYMWAGYERVLSSESSQQLLTGLDSLGRVDVKADTPVRIPELQQCGMNNVSPDEHLLVAVLDLYAAMTRRMSMKRNQAHTGQDLPIRGNRFDGALIGAQH